MHILYIYIYMWTTFAIIVYACYSCIQGPFFSKWNTVSPSDAFYHKFASWCTPFNWLTSDGMQRMSFQRLETDIFSVLNIIFDAHNMHRQSEWHGCCRQHNHCHQQHQHHQPSACQPWIHKPWALPNIRLLTNVGYTSHHIPIISSFVPSGYLT